MSDPKSKLQEIIRTQCLSGPISYIEYIEAALYTKDLGYYQRSTDRIGRSFKQDFYTAESLGCVFAKLICTAAVDIIGSKAKSHRFVEIGAELKSSLLRQLDNHPFNDEQVIRLGDPVTVDGSVIIFANEWLDALPFHRLVFLNGIWRERGIGLNASGELSEVLLEKYTPAVASVVERLPNRVKDGYQLDLPLKSEDAIKALLIQDWKGLIMIFDYGHTWMSLLQDHFEGTARCYKSHGKSNNLLCNPGDYDITCDICWTPIMDQMEACGLRSVTLESQESFIVKRARRETEAIISSDPGKFSPDRQTLMELIHPANMGQKFQVLWGIRD